MVTFLEALPFITTNAWNYSAETLEFTPVTQTNPLGNSSPRNGWFLGFEGLTTDSQIQAQIQGDNFTLDFSPQELYDTGTTQMNPVFPFLTKWQPTVGTAGTFAISYTPVNPFPIQKQISYSFKLGPNSTQTSATVELAIGFITVTDPVAFLQAYQQLQQATAPSYTATLSTPVGPQTLTLTPKPLAQNPITIPQVRAARQVKTEEQELSELT